LGKQASNNVNYQERAHGFSVGDVVAPYGMLESWAGRVTAVWPAIGMVDIETSLGNRRYPVEELQKFDRDGDANPPVTDSAPAGGSETVKVPGSPARVAQAFQKISLYWASRDRKYRLSQPELSSGKPCCPRCEDHPPLKKVVFKTRDGVNERLLGCKACLFLVHPEDLVGAS